MRMFLHFLDILGYLKKIPMQTVREKKYPRLLWSCLFGKLGSSR